MEYVLGKLVLEDGSVIIGRSFASASDCSGEVVFNTGMTGYPESLSDPSYYGQILCFTYPLIGNYGIPAKRYIDNLIQNFESERPQIAGLIVSSYSGEFSHFDAAKSLAVWLNEHNIPALEGVDTRALTQKLRTSGTMLGRISFSKTDIVLNRSRFAQSAPLLDKERKMALFDPNATNVTSIVSTDKPILYRSSIGKKRVALLDCGVKASIIKSLLSRGLDVLRLPWNADPCKVEDVDGLVISNGPGNPALCKETIANISKWLEYSMPTLGICLGNQLLALAAGGKTFKLRFGHRAQNQPCMDLRTKRAYITSQNHGFAVDADSLPSGWEPWFANINDGTNEGIIHERKPFMATQFHPEANPGPTDAEWVFDKFAKLLRC